MKTAITKACRQCQEEKPLVCFHIDKSHRFGRHHVPGTTATNMLPLCKPCNRSKADRDPIAWLVDWYGRDADAILDRIAAYFSLANSDTLPA